MAWIIRLNNGEYSFAATTKYSIQDRAEIKEDNSTEFFESVLNVEGELFGGGADPAADVTAKYKALRAFMFKTAAFRIEILRDGTVEHDFQPGQYIGTPKMRDLVQVPTDGADHASHERFQASFYIRKPTVNYGQQLPTGSLERRITETQEEGKVVRKEWYARATARDLGTARALVMSYKPGNSSQKGMRQVLSESPDTNTFEGTWTWEKTSDLPGVVDFEENVQIKSSGHPYIEDPVVGNNAAPVFHKGRFRAGEILIRFSMSTKDPNIILQPPAAHLSSGGDVIRDKTREPASEPPVLIDPIEGIWRATFYEFYYFTGATPPALNHTGHNTPYQQDGSPGSSMGGSL